MPNSLTIGKSIKKVRKGKKITQKALAEKTGYHVNIISRWETGLEIPNLRAAIAVADALEVSIDELVGRVFKLKPVGGFPFDCCPKSDRVVLRTNRYCPDSGQAIDWSDTE